MLPVIALVGRPNVGKSTLFNCLTQSRDALVADIPGLTRDRKYGEVLIGETPCLIVDTGGIGESKEGIAEHMETQSKLAIDEADIVLFLVDAEAGVTPGDQKIAGELRKLGKLILLVVNKVDGKDEAVACADFHQLGLSAPIPIAAAHRRNIQHLISLISEEFPRLKRTFSREDEPADMGIKIAIAGRPNVGKSTLVNRILGEERVLVFDEAGTTRDSIYVPFQRSDQTYTLIDTAGVRRRGRVSNVIEKYSIIKTLQAINDAHVVVILLDAQEGVVEQDLHVIDFVLQAGKAVVVGINKWDGLTEDHKEQIRHGLSRRLNFIDFARFHFISALHGTNVGHLFKSINEAYRSATRTFSTKAVTETLLRAVSQHEPPLKHGHRIKLRYAHVGGHNPPLFVIHGNQTEHLPEVYKRYLINFFRERFKLVGTPIRLELKSGENPFKGRKNKLTPRQINKKRRLKAFTKRKS